MAMDAEDSRYHDTAKLLSHGDYRAEKASHKFFTDDRTEQVPLRV